MTTDGSFLIQPKARSPLHAHFCFQMLTNEQKSSKHRSPVKGKASLTCLGWILWHFTGIAWNLRSIVSSGFASENKRAIGLGLLIRNASGSLGEENPEGGVVWLLLTHGLRVHGRDLIHVAGLLFGPKNVGNTNRSFQCAGLPLNQPPASC